MSHSRRTPRADGDSTRAKLIDAAGRLFAERGYAGAASKAICAAAGTDLAAINYHFGSRDGLYRAVLREGHMHFVNLDELTALTCSAQSAAQKLERFIDAIVDGLIHDQGWHTRVCAREILAPSAHFGSLINDEVMPKFAQVAAIVSEFTGISVGDPALARCVVSVMAPCLMLLVIDRDSASPVQALLSQPAAELATHLKRFALAGLEAERTRRLG